MLDKSPIFCVFCKTLYLSGALLSFLDSIFISFMNYIVVENCHNKSSDALELTVVIPCLNEEETIKIVVKKAISSMKRLNILGEVLVVDNASVDHSREIAQKEGARVLECKKKGYGNALRTGFKAAKGRYIIMGDADDSYNFEEIDSFIIELRKGNEFVMGSRLRGEIEKGAMPFLHRYLGTPVLTFVLNSLFGTRITDCNCGMRGFKKGTILEMNLSAAGMELASEMVIKAGIQGVRIKEVSVNLYKDKRTKPPHLDTWRDGWRHLKFMLVYAPNQLFMMPGSFFFCVGTFLIFMQAGGPVHGEFLYMGIHFMILGLTLSVFGILLLQMGVVIKLFSSMKHYYSQSKELYYIRKLSIEKGITVGGAMLLGGLAVDLFLLIHWFNASFRDIYQPHIAVIGLYFMLVGLFFILFSFLKVIMQSEE